MAREFPSPLQLDVPPDNAPTQQTTVPVRQLARNVDAGVHRPVVHVVRVGAEVGKLETEGLEPIGSRDGVRC